MGHGTHREGDGHDAAELTLAVYADRLVNDVVSTNTARTYRTACRSLLAFLEPNASVEALDLDAIRRWTSALRDEGKAPSTVATYASIARALHALVRHQPRRRPTTSSTRRLRPLTPTEHDVLLGSPDTSTTTGCRDLAILQLAAHVRMTSTEIANLHKTAVESAGPSDGPATRTALRAWRSRRPSVAFDVLFVTLPAVAGRQPQPMLRRDIERVIERHARRASIRDSPWTSSGE